MKDNIVLRWTLSAVLILVIVIGSYSVFAKYAEPSTSEHAGHVGEQNTSDSSDTKDKEKQEAGHGDHGESQGNVSKNSDITPTLHYENNLIHIELKDKEGNPVEELEIDHEKLMHLIIVNDELQQYYHIHPEKKGNGVFTIQHKLEEGSYKAFIDIKPKDKNYEVQPLPIEVGAGDAHGEHDSLKPETEFTKTVNGYKLTMSPETFTSGEEIVLDFDLKENKPEPYLGALGHVVILDEGGDEYVHVHPASETDTKFATKFDQPGIYKIWGEFKINGKVNVYPFVVEVK
ncbi:MULTISPECIES: hypothetical protein [Fictibacillus]|jgi:hypothetical protein|uniref:hypothetical protein n=1 Tax=Fictibacillus TaxID=1329200 RepID=UPI0018CE8ED6|nr:MULTISPECIES: hypothetical protein [unclassified Fictibacillus]MBH0157209.1 hypothetical protein [Fictibacillus sp. 5RED26]MBH0159530.1 hypothetical protein [Fictibacillus sp. 26RED30]MBH0163671.1 hypothetical protein [Fictibacillus sp. 7GRE50]MBH0169703.1 hypothetical protein [Fictibacillus sp. 18YEL24]MBH0174203.1 hypothetical protein [Fictibacillus sp. 23RED33]